MNFKYPLSNNSWKKKEIDALRRVIATNKFTMGKKVKIFEKKFSKYL